MKLTDFLKDKKQSELDIASVEVQFSEQNNDRIAILHLATPLAVVTGSQIITDDGTGAAERVQAFDVEQVKVHETDLEDAGFEMDADGSGLYSGDLRLDVSKRTGEVWLRSESFASSARTMRNENTNKRSSGMLEKIKARRAGATAKV